MNLIKYILPFYIVIAFVNLSSCTIHAEDDNAHSEPEKVNQPSTHEEPSLENEHEDAVDINLTNQQILNAGIELTEVSQGLLPESRRIYGEIHLNAEQVAHKYPQYPGIIRDVRVNIGDLVSTGDTLAIIFNTSTLSTYPMISSQTGEILEKHAVVGEYADGSEPIVVVGNLNTVWVDLHAFEKDREILRKGQTITLYSTNGNASIKTKIRYIKPIMNAETRTNIVRCVVDNTSRIWNPGRLVFADVEYHRDNMTTLIVPQD
ncbi:efflux RND transporter periplasmic adaptor subunit, partial [bacterium]|nr:efflux RND transporter periplasmic adaptor subunit [bacterium]